MIFLIYFYKSKWKKKYIFFFWEGMLFFFHGDIVILNMNYFFILTLIDDFSILIGNFDTLKDGGCI
jgi:hypothetical protein